MHAIFIPYGMDDRVQNTLRDMKSQNFQIPYTSPTGEKKVYWTKGSLRILPGGVYEYIFPKEYKNEVLTTLDFHKPMAYNLDQEIKFGPLKIKPINYLRKFLRIEEIKKEDFERTKGFLWDKEHVGIICLGIRHDGELKEIGGKWDGWTHEAL